MLTNLRRRRARGDRGAVLVEAAFALPVLFLVTFAIIEFGMFFSTSSTTTTSTRDGARYATAFYAIRTDKMVVGAEVKGEVERDLKALTGQATPVKLWIYKATATGDPTGGLSCTANCMLYTWSAASKTFIYTSGTWTTVDACITSASPAVDDVGVMVEVSHKMLTGVVGRTARTVRERSVLRLEPLPTSQC